MEDTKIRKAVREGYANIARKESSCCSPVNSCCAPKDSDNTVNQVDDISKKIGYTDEELTVLDALTKSDVPLRSVYGISQSIRMEISEV